MLSFSTNEAKLIVVPNKLFPSSLMEEEIELIKKINCSHIKIEEFIQIQKINNLNMKLIGLSVCDIKRLDNNSLKQ